MRGSILLWAVLFVMVGYGLSARILVVLPFPGKSHFVFSSAILNALLRRGHHIVEYSPFPPGKPLANYTHIEIHTSLEKMLNNWSYDEFAQMISKDQPVVGTGFNQVWRVTREVCMDTFKLESIKNLLNSNEQFDLVLTESTFGQESILIFGHRFGAPTITLQGFSSWSALNRDAGNSLSIASIPDMVCIIGTDKMSFFERLLNFISTLITLFLYYNRQLPAQDMILKENFGLDAPPVADLVSNVSLYLVNTHPTVEYPQPYTPNIIPVGGVIIEPDRIPLPKDLQYFMDEAKEGVIYFSLGTVVPVHLMPSEFLQMFTNVFKKLKHKVLWKTDLESIPGLSNNVKLVKWIPQPGVLAHPNCMLFLTHGGVFGQQEAIHTGVPVVGIPFFGDQPYNMKFAEHRGIGIKLAFRTLSEDRIMSAINTVLNNPKYRENSQRLSKIFRDRPISAADSAVFWVEYVLRHKGAHHLRSAATKLSWYQLALLDVLAAVLISLLAITATLFLVVKRVVSLMFKSNTQLGVTKKKKEN